MRWVDEEKLVVEVERAARAYDDPWFVSKAVRAWLGRQAEVPYLVGATVAAKILGVQTPHISRLREQGRMPKAVEVEGSIDAYVREEVEELARELQAERQDRAKRRAERTGV